MLGHAEGEMWKPTGEIPEVPGASVGAVAMVTGQWPRCCFAWGCWSRTYITHHMTVQRMNR